MILFEHKLLYKAKGPVPEGHYTVPIGQAAVRREGRDVTHGGDRDHGLARAGGGRDAGGEGIEAEVIDPRSLRPLDMPAIIASVKKTSRLMCVYEGVKAYGVGAEISAAVVESEAFDYLDAPVVRLGGADAPVPYSPVLERAMAPQAEDIVAAARELARE